MYDGMTLLGSGDKIVCLVVYKLFVEVGSSEGAFWVAMGITEKRWEQNLLLGKAILSSRDV